jgi:hypothetical protein
VGKWPACAIVQNLAQAGHLFTAAAPSARSILRPGRVQWWCRTSSARRWRRRGGYRRSFHPPLGRAPHSGRRDRHRQDLILVVHARPAAEKVMQCHLDTPQYGATATGLDAIRRPSGAEGQHTFLASRQIIVQGRCAEAGPRGGTANFALKRATNPGANTFAASFGAALCVGVSETLVGRGVAPVADRSARDWNLLVFRHSLRTISLTEARSRKPRARRLRHSQSLARRWQRFSHASVRSTTLRFGSTRKPLTASER